MLGTQNYAERAVQTGHRKAVADEGGWQRDRRHTSTLADNGTRNEGLWSLTALIADRHRQSPEGTTATGLRA